MSEVEKHYAPDRTASRDPGHGGARGGSERGERGRSGEPGSLSEKAAQAVEGVRGSVREAASWSRDRYRDSSEWVSDGLDSVSRNATYMRRRSAAEFSRRQRTVESFVEENPIMIGVVGLAAGLLIGSLIPGTRRENQYLGRYADEIRDQGLRYAREMAEQGRHMVEENLGRLSQAGTDRDTGDETTAAR